MVTFKEFVTLDLILSIPGFFLVYNVNICSGHLPKVQKIVYLRTCKIGIWDYVKVHLAYRFT